MTSIKKTSCPYIAEWCQLPSQPKTTHKSLQELQTAVLAKYPAAVNDSCQFAFFADTDASTCLVIVTYRLKRIKS